MDVIDCCATRSRSLRGFLVRVVLVNLVVVAAVVSVVSNVSGWRPYLGAQVERTFM